MASRITLRSSSTSPGEAIITLKIVALYAMSLIPYFRAFSMRAQSFQLREFLYGGQRFLERGAVVFHQAGAALELVHGQAGIRCARAAGRQRVARPGHVITQHRRRPGPEENRARRQDAGRNMSRERR